MSKKRRKAKGKQADRAEQGVPDEVLAEGSGPVAEPVEAAPEVEAAPVAVEAAPEVVEAVAEPVELVDAAPVKAKGRKGRRAAADTIAELAPELIALAIDDSADETIDVTITVEDEAPAYTMSPIEVVELDEVDDEPDPELLAAALEDEANAGADLPVDTAAIDAQELKNLVEALIFAADKPVTLQRLRQLSRVGDVRRLEEALAQLAEDYRERGLALQCISGGYQFRTATRYSSWVQQLIEGRPVRLSRAQLETLAIIAYRQPITRPEIDEIRGVDSSATLKLLLDRSLVRVLGKREEVGRPMLYGTTKEFLDFFSLGDLRELPTLREYSELSDESRQEMSDRLGIEPEATPISLEALANEPMPEPDDVDVRFEPEVPEVSALDAMAAWAAEADPLDDAAPLEAVAEPAVDAVDAVDAGDDDLFADAVRHVRTTGNASVTSLQRHLRVSHGRAARLVAELAARGLLAELAPPIDDAPIEDDTLLGTAHEPAELAAVEPEVEPDRQPEVEPGEPTEPTEPGIGDPPEEAPVPGPIGDVPNEGLPEGDEPPPDEPIGDKPEPDQQIQVADEAVTAIEHHHVPLVVEEPARTLETLASKYSAPRGDQEPAQDADDLAEAAEVVLAADAESDAPSQDVVAERVAASIAHDDDADHQPD